MGDFSSFEKMIAPSLVLIWRVGFSWLFCVDNTRIPCKGCLSVSMFLCSVVCFGWLTVIVVVVFAAVVVVVTSANGGIEEDMTVHEQFELVSSFCFQQSRKTCQFYNLI